MASPSTAATSERVAVFDGIRGLAIVLVILSHLWIVWEGIRNYDNRLVETATLNGNNAVSIFFVIGAFFFTRALLRKSESPHGFFPGVEILRRYLRLTPTVAVLLLVAWIVTLAEDEPTYPDQSLGDSAQTVLTYTWNWYLQNQVLNARPDFGHLWYLSVYMQAFVLVAVLVYFLRHRRGWLLLTLATMLLAAFLWRANSPDDLGALLLWMARTSVRIDAPLAGALAACLLPYLARFRDWGPQVAWGALAAMVGLSVFTVDEYAFLGLPGSLFDLALMAFVIGCALAPSPHRLATTLGNPVLAFLGRHSLSLYVWHFPIFRYLEWNTESWDWGGRLVVALTVSVAVAWVNDRTVERVVGALLRHPRWRLLDAGFVGLFRRLTASTSTAHDTAAGEATSAPPAAAEDSGTRRASRSSWTREGPYEED